MRKQVQARLSIFVNEQGIVTNAIVTEKSGFPSFDQLAAETVKKWRFVPAYMDGQPTALWYHDWLWSVDCTP